MYEINVNCFKLTTVYFINLICICLFTFILNVCILKHQEDGKRIFLKLSFSFMVGFFFAL